MHLNHEKIQMTFQMMHLQTSLDIWCHVGLRLSICTQTCVDVCVCEHARTCVRMCVCILTQTNLTSKRHLTS